MKKYAVPIFILLYCLASKNTYLCTVAPQSLFFVSAVSHSGILDADIIKNPHGKALKGALICTVGFAVSMLLTIISAEKTTLSHIALASVAFGSYLCFYSVLLLMHKNKKNKERMRRICVLCAVLPCFSSVTKDSGPSEASAIAVISLGCILFGIAIYSIRCKHKQ